MTFSPGSNLNYAFKNHVYLRHKKEGHANITLPPLRKRVNLTMVVVFPTLAAYFS